MLNNEYIKAFFFSTEEEKGAIKFLPDNFLAGQVFDRALQCNN